MLFATGDLADHNVEATRAWYRNVIRSLCAPSDCKNRLRRRLKLRVNTQLTELVFAPYEHLRILDDYNWLWNLVLRRHLWWLGALSVRRGYRLLRRGAYIHYHPAIIAISRRGWI